MGEMCNGRPAWDFVWEAQELDKLRIVSPGFSVLIFFFFFKKKKLVLRGMGGGGEGQRERKREPQAGSVLGLPSCEMVT